MTLESRELNRGSYEAPSIKLTQRSNSMNSMYKKCILCGKVFPNRTDICDKDGSVKFIPLELVQNEEKKVEDKKDKKKK